MWLLYFRQCLASLQDFNSFFSRNFTKVVDERGVADERVEAAGDTVAASGRLPILPKIHADGAVGEGAEDEDCPRVVAEDDAVGEGAVFLGALPEVMELWRRALAFVTCSMLSDLPDSGRSAPARWEELPASDAADLLRT